VGAFPSKSECPTGYELELGEAKRRIIHPNQGVHEGGQPSPLIILLYKFYRMDIFIKECIGERDSLWQF
jgi:hypothetical protein